MVVVCGENNCRKVIRPDDMDTYYQEWDKKIRKSMKKVFKVEQPLLQFVDAGTRSELDDFFMDPGLYKSVYSLKLKETKI